MDSVESRDVRPGQSLRSKSGNTYRSKVKACNRCRQYKVRCDSAITFPDTCSRCKKKGLDCNVDSAFKPTPTRNLLEEVTSQLTSIQQTLQQRDSSVYVFQEHVCGGISLAARPNVDSMNNNSRELGFIAKQLTADGNSVLERQELGGVVLESSTISDLVAHFRANHWKYFPILDEDFSATTLLQASPLLFWTVVSISSRYHVSHSHLYNKMAESYTKLLAEALVTSLRSVHAIQAVLYHCLWPLPVKTQDSDPSWTQCSLAVSAALQLGLHKPGFEKEYMREYSSNARAISPEEKNIRSKTWMGCVYVSTR
ncbi:hypothetical protein V1508DRAFT_418361 [Lipomyces doorenjongii]|uniref:uncharacterized protein n=1 Tax=Lipomyces doorenjongii TaxID=383834 RepID=UPI0034CEDB92